VLLEYLENLASSVATRGILAIPNQLIDSYFLSRDYALGTLHWGLEQ